MLIYFMLQGEMPFGSWRESEIDIVSKIAKGQLSLPRSPSPEAVDLISKVFFKNQTCCFSFSFFLQKTFKIISTSECYLKIHIRFSVTRS